MRFRTLFLTLAISFALYSCASSQGSLQIDRATLSQYAFGLPEYDAQYNAQTVAAPSPQANPLWATQYYVHYAEATNANGHALLDMDGKSFGVNLSDYDWCHGGVEGTILVKDSAGNLRTYNYAGRGKELQVDCSKFFKGPLIKPEAIGRTRYTYARGEFGDGVKGLMLVPFRTIAVDTTTYPIGSVLYIPGVRGTEIELPSGKKVLHDGYFFAGDIGGAIKGNHIDVFTGVYRKNPFPKIVQSKASATFPVVPVNDERIIALLRDLHVYKGK